jgi:hypothetical protein
MQVRCPKCGAAAPVPALIPAEEVPVVEAAVVSPAPKPKRVVADEDDEIARPSKKAQRDEDDEDEPPRKKKKRPRYADDDDDYPHDHPRRHRRRGSGGGGGSGAIVAVVVVVGLLLLAGGGVGIYFLTGKGESLAKKPPVPDGWKQFTYSNDGFKAYFPKEPQVMTVAGNRPFGGVGGMNVGRGGFGGTNELQEVESVSTYTCVGPGEHTVSVVIVRFRNDVPRSVRNEFSRFESGQLGGIESRKVRWLGSDAIELVMNGMVSRIAITGRLMVCAQITGPNGGRAKPEEENGFFGNIELTK